MRLPAKLDPANVIAIIDSREQNALNLAPRTSVVSELDTGDYSVSLRNFLTKTATIFPAHSSTPLTFDRSHDNDSPHAARTCNPTSRAPLSVAACFRSNGSA